MRSNCLFFLYLQAHAAYQQTLGDESRYYMTLNSMLGFEIDKVIDDLYFKVSQGFPPEDDLKKLVEIDVSLTVCCFYSS